MQQVDISKYPAQMYLRFIRKQDDWNNIYYSYTGVQVLLLGAVKSWSMVAIIIYSMFKKWEISRGFISCLLTLVSLSI